jgi:hypothetical protein
MKVKMMMVFWVVRPCGVAGRYQCSALKLQAVYFSRTLVSTYKSTQSYYSEDQHGLKWFNNILWPITGSVLVSQLTMIHKK